ncbi:hypothetical protein [Maritimibacter dapengensis]|uniref:Uncharacterized protein n=1 Tax=Maritimibacter dapengensis TaxID=2836868 RepID=A0ABS6T421_9RHOB|nr:hypothetical protein [Maritimibacter dapengensis]MBV7379291.1 hypothetical protein [Maritimibacter dapengensis]
MKQAIWLVAMTVAALELAFLRLGFDVVADVAYGTIAIMALLIACTFLWLWFERTTPLAIGMVVSWLGISWMAGWWWAYNLMGTPTWAQDHPALFAVLALPIVGAVLHFAVIQRSFGFHGLHFLWPVLGAIAVSCAVHVVHIGF